MSRRLRSLVDAIILVLVTSAGCAAHLPEGRFHCLEDRGCPAGMFCHPDMMLCYRTPALDANVAPHDMGPITDAQVPDGGPPIDMGVPIDAAPQGDVGCTDCIMLTLTNAYGPTMGTIGIEGTGMSMPPYGGTVAAFQVSLGNGMLDVTPFLGTAGPFPATPGMSYALVVGHDPNPATGAPVVLLLPPPNGVARTGYFATDLVDLLQDTTDLSVADVMNYYPLTATHTGPLTQSWAVNSSSAIRVHTTTPGGTANIISVFATNELPQMGTYYVALAGRTDRHLGAADGIRAIPIVPGAPMIPSRPIVWGLNATDGTITICDGTSVVMAAIPDHLTQSFAGFGPTTPSGMGRTLSVYPGSSCSGTTPIQVTIPVPDSAHVSGRVLVAAYGSLSGSWNVQAVLEEGPPMMHAGAAQLIDYVDGSTTVDMQFGAGTMPNVGNTMHDQSAFYDWAPQPMNLTIQYNTTPVMFSWGLMSRSAFCVGTQVGSTYYAYEIDTTYGQEWLFSKVQGS